MTKEEFKELHSAMENNEASIFWEVEDAIL